MTQRTGAFRTRMRSTLLNDPYLYDRLLEAAEQAHLFLRDQIIVRMGCESGARIHEILCLSLGDWRKRGYGREVLSFNKSKMDQQVKLICFSPQTRELLLRYIDGERKQHDPQRRDLALLTDTDALFLSGRGRTYGYGAFLLHWKRLCQVAGITFPPSGLRHWFAIQALLQIEERTNNPTDGELVKKVLVQYLGWQSPDVFETDDHMLFLKRLEEESMKVHDLNQPVPIDEVCKLPASIEPCPHSPP